MKRFFYLLFALLIGMMSWENQLEAASLADPGPIPEQSIRLRIIANSDSFRDQWLKREVRDAIIDQVNQWVEEVRSIDQARSQVATRLPELQQLVERTIRERGFRYQADVQFGQVAFPTKLYGSYVYPAGQYEALLVRLGEAKGQNWWCVLFPPLCFIDMSNGDAIEQTKSPTDDSDETSTSDAVAEQDHLTERERDSGASDSQTGFFDAWFAAEEESDRTETDRPAAEQTAAGQVQTVAAASTALEQDPAPQVEVRFFFWEKLSSLFG
ncbi:stage II sporulation protein R [Brevibacillus humidisoli]|uniref:stage II sporulation protein R n=1 Tax=Brevibacillus humidisoli TaxID=2895522 RepID=UPI001E5AEA7B|nr:stage II sporulation protein R [Brevibacillus humidisoli]UFJ40190.1 stage II sporulation protein R [Brevibacillus humidisoli]